MHAIRFAVAMTLAKGERRCRAVKTEANCAGSGTGTGTLSLVETLSPQ